MSASGFAAFSGLVVTPGTWPITAGGLDPRDDDREGFAAAAAAAEDTGGVVLGLAARCASV